MVHPSHGANVAILKIQYSEGELMGGNFLLKTNSYVDNINQVLSMHIIETNINTQKEFQVTMGHDSAHKRLRLNKSQLDWQWAIFEWTTQRVTTWKQVNKRVRNHDSVMSEKTITKGEPKFDTYENNAKKRDPFVYLWALVGYYFTCRRSILGEETPKRRKPWNLVRW